MCILKIEENLSRNYNKIIIVYIFVNKSQYTWIMPDLKQMTTIYNLQQTTTRAIISMIKSLNLSTNYNKWHIIRLLIISLSYPKFSQKTTLDLSLSLSHSPVLPRIARKKVNNSQSAMAPMIAGTKGATPMEMLLTLMWCARWRWGEGAWYRSLICWQGFSSTSTRWS